MNNLNKKFDCNSKRPKIIFIQPGYAHYRKKLFVRLAENFDVLFIFINSLSNYPSLDKPEKNWRTIYLNAEKNKFFHIMLIKILLSESYDAIVTSLSGSYQSIISYCISKLRKKTHIIWNERWYAEYQYCKRTNLFKNIRRKLSQHIARKSDSVVVAGSASLRYHKKLGIQEKKIFVANNSVDGISKFNKNTISKDVLGINRKFIILYLSRIISLKGLDILICAFKKLEAARDDVFLLVGGDGEFRGYCENLRCELKIDNIKFVGSIKNEHVYDYFSIADIFVLPSCIRKNAEAWGLVINEAMSAGKPIITTDAVGCAEDMVVNGTNGYIVKNNNIEEMYEALKAITDGGKKIIEIMGKNSKKIFNEFNDYNKMYDGFKAAILNSLNHSKL